MRLPGALYMEDCWLFRLLMFFTGDLEAEPWVLQMISRCICRRNEWVNEHVFIRNGIALKHRRPSGLFFCECGRFVGFAFFLPCIRDFVRRDGGWALPWAVNSVWSRLFLERPPSAAS